MPLYSVRRHFSTFDNIEVEADDEDHARDMCYDRETEVDEANANMEIVDVDIELSDNQYTAEQELADAERRHEDF